ARRAPGAVPSRLDRAPRLARGAPRAHRRPDPHEHGGTPMSDRTTSAPDGTLERTSDGALIRFERRLPYSVREVWDAITKPARLAEWWLPFDADVTVDLREGGAILFAGTGDEPITITCTVLRVVERLLLERTHLCPGSYRRRE